MIEAFLKREFRKTGKFYAFIEVKSAGIHPEAKTGSSANKHSIKEMADRGIDISDHKSTRVDDVQDLDQFDSILFVGKEELDMFTKHINDNYSESDAFAISLGTKMWIVNGDKGGIPNPYKKGPEAYAECAETIEKAMVEIAQKILSPWRNT